MCDLAIFRACGIKPGITINLKEFGSFWGFSCPQHWLSSEAVHLSQLSFLPKRFMPRLQLCASSVKVESDIRCSAQEGGLNDPLSSHATWLFLWSCNHHWKKHFLGPPHAVTCSELVQIFFQVCDLNLLNLRKEWLVICLLILLFLFSVKFTPPI